MHNPREFYTQQKDQYTAELNSLKRRSVSVAIARLAVFLPIAICFYYFFSNDRSSLLLLAGFAGIILFIVLIRISVSLSERKNLVTQLIFINRNELDIIDNKPNALDDGQTVFSPQLYANDLDVFGPGSLYHLLNRTTTEQGAANLFAQLNLSVTSRQTILDQQTAIKQFSIQPELRQMIMANGLLLEEGSADINDIASWIDEPEQLLDNALIKVLKILLPIVSIAGVFLYLDNNNPLLIGIGVIGNWMVLGYFGKYTAGQHILIGKKDTVLKQYGIILDIFATSDTRSSSLLTQIKSISEEGRAEILRLSKLSAFFDQRLNLLVAFFLNSLLQYDTHVMTALENWKRKNRSHFMKWIDAVGEIEKLNSFATFHFNHPAYPFPLVTEGKPRIDARSLGHPLIPRSRQVANDITAGQDEKLLLITGSNMSGKSTFLRTIGVNVLLAQCGMPVCAASFSFTPMQILSSINISDSLAQNTSYFMAELKRLKDIISRLESGGPSLVLIDEVLRGTNSDDKTYGSEELIKTLATSNCLSFFASHDLNLSVLENKLNGKVKNYCFESTIVDDELLFDYKLHRGVAKNKNASFLMKKMGIIS